MAVVELNGYRIDTQYYTSDGYLFTDSKNRKITLNSQTLWHPDFYRKTRIRTFRGVLNWFIENKEAIRNIEHEGWVLDFLYGCASFFRYSDTSAMYRMAPSHFETEVLERECPSFNVVETPSLTTTYLLENVVPPELTYNIYSLGRFGKVSLKPKLETDSDSEDIWFKLYEWSYKMSSTSYGFFRQLRKEVDMFFGLELEISTKLSPAEIQRIVTEVEPKQKPFFIFKKDVSVTGKYQNKVEIVTVPCTPRYLRHNFKILFKKIEGLCEKKGKGVGDFFDINPDLNNGLHIHVSRECFSNKFDERKFLLLWNTKSRETKRLFNRVACRPGGVGTGYCRTSEYHKIYSTAFLLKSDVSIERQTMCHGNNSSTLEVRAYQGIFNIDHILRCISFTEACVEYVGQAGNRDVFDGFVPRMKDLIFSAKKYASLQGVFK